MRYRAAVYPANIETIHVMQARHAIAWVPFPSRAYALELPAGISAMFYVEQGQHVYGWYAEARRTRYRAAFFMIENFYAEHATSLYRSTEDDLYGSWMRELPSPFHHVRCPVPDLLVHELDRLQSAFIDEWLFFTGDPSSGSEVRSYAQRKLPLLGFNVRSRRLGQLATTNAVWSHQSPGTNGNILDFLQKSWRFSGKEVFIPTQAVPMQAARR